MSECASEATHQPSGGEPGGRREYRYSAWAWVGAGAASAGCVLCLGLSIWLLGEFGGKDLSYLRLWPLWIRGLFLMLVPMLSWTIVLVCYLYVRWFASLAWHYQDRFIVDDHGLTIVRRGSATALPWGSVCVCTRSHLLAWRIWGGSASYLVVPGGTGIRQMCRDIGTRSAALRADGPQP